MSGLFGGGGSSQNNSAPAIGGINIQTSNYGAPVPIIYGRTRVSTNLMWYGAFQAVAHTTTQSSGGKGGGGPTNTNTTYTYQASIQMGLCEGPIGGIGTIWVGKATESAAALGMAIFYGTYPQNPWSYLTSNFPGQDLGYAGVAHVDAANYPLDGNASFPNHSFEILGRLQYGAGIVDANPADVITDLLTNPNYGCGFPAGMIGDMTQYSNYCVANGLFVSPAYASQKQASTMLDDLLTDTNSVAVWSANKLRILPYGDQVISGNGATFTPAITPIYDLTDDHFLVNSGSDPITVIRTSNADAFNQVQLEYLNRSNQYAPDIVTAKDLGSIQAFGLRPMSMVTAHEYCVTANALQAAYLILQRQLYIRNTFEFKLGWAFCLLEPMDIVTITDTRLGLNKYQVRITSVEEDIDGALTIRAEEFPFGVASAALYSTQSALGYSSDYNVAAPNANAPVIFTAPPELASSGLELWMAASGPAGWGGCQVWISSDNATYKNVGSIHGNARHGVLSAVLGIGTDPDTVNALAVDLSVSGGMLLSGTLVDANDLNTLCYVNGEFLSYETATLTAASKYNLTYLRRGAYNSASGYHAAGSQFARVDQALFAYPFTQDQIGKTIYIKLVSFNQYAGGLQDLASVSPITYVIAGPLPPLTVQGFTVRQSGGAVVFTWTRLLDYALKGYDIRYGPSGTTDWNLMSTLVEASYSTEMTNASVPPGDWVFAIRGRDIADQLSPTMATVTLTVTNENTLILDARQDKDFTGTYTNCIRHPSGAVVPLDTNVASYYTQWEDFGIGPTANNPGALPFIPFPVASCSFDTVVYDTAFNDTLRVYDSTSIVPGPGVIGTPASSFSIDTWLTGATDPATWTPWVTGSVQMRYIKARLTLTPGSVPSYLSAFSLFADKGGINTVDGASGVVVAAGGTAISFTQVFHHLPVIIPTLQGGVAGNASAANESITGFTAHVFNSAGADVGGTITWSATGV